MTDMPLIVDCDPHAAHPVIYRRIDGADPIALTRDQAQTIIDETAHVLDLLDAAAAAGAPIGATRP